MPAAAAQLPDISACLTGVCSSAASMQHSVPQHQSGRAALQVSLLGAAPLAGKACCVPKGVQPTMPPAGPVYNPRTMRLPKPVVTILSWNVCNLKRMLAEVGGLAGLRLAGGITPEAEPLGAT